MQGIGVSKKSAITTFRNAWSSAIKWSFWFTPLRRKFFYQYQYNFTPAQLAYFIECLDRTKAVPGAIYEIGCALGCTTVFLNRHMGHAGIEKPYICVDTFGGFTAADVSWEIDHRGKGAYDFSGFRVNNVSWFQYTMRLNSCSRVRCRPADVQRYEFEDQVSFCLLDVDLYKPSLAALEKVWARLQPGGIVVVDDCVDRSNFDGAYQAYIEFANRVGLTPKIVLGKLGVLQAPE